MDHEERLIRLALALGPAAQRRTMSEFDSVKTALEEHWTTHRGAYPIWAKSQTISDLIHRMERLASTLETKGFRAIFSNESEYPVCLLNLEQAPSVLYVWGEIPAQEMIAIVGSRGAQLNSVKTAFRLSQELVAAGMAVISGGAMGIDTAAHEGALAGGGYTMAILGSGLDRLYPERNKRLFSCISSRGAVISPYPLGTPPRAFHFPQRNCYIAAWAKVLVVVEAQLRSGALSTANWAKKFQRPILALDTSPGAKLLLRQGAGVLSSTQDILDALIYGHPLRFPVLDPKCPDQREVLSLLRQKPHTIDDVAKCLGWKAARVASALLRLELEGFISTAAGGLYKAVLNKEKKNLKSV